MELTDVNRTFRRHRRAWWWPWHCRCGRCYPCPPRMVAVEALVALKARAACDWYPRYFCDQQRTEQQGPA